MWIHARVNMYYVRTYVSSLMRATFPANLIFNDLANVITVYMFPSVNFN
jgi:hypothetical protein